MRLITWDDEQGTGAKLIGILESNFSIKVQEKSFVSDVAEFMMQMDYRGESDAIICLLPNTLDLGQSEGVIQALECHGTEADIVIYGLDEYHESLPDLLREKSIRIVSFPCADEMELRSSAEFLNGYVQGKLRADFKSQQLLSSIKSILFQTNNTGGIIYWNDFCSFLFGRPAAEIMGRSLDDAALPFETSTLRQASQEVIDKGCSVRLDDLEFRQQGGATGLLGITVHPIWDEEKKVSGVLFYGADVTQKRVEAEKLLLAEKKYKMIFEKSSVGIFLLDPSGKVLQWNHYAENLFLKSDKEFVRVPFDELFPESERELVSKNLLVKGKESISFDSRIARSESKLRDMNVTVSQVIGRDEKCLGIICVIRDVTEHKELERLKDEFVSAVSHEIRTPLTVIREGMAQLQEGILGPMTPGQLDFVDISLQEVDRLTTIVRDLLDVSKIEAGRFMLKRRFTNLTQVFRVLRESFGRSAKSRGIDLALKVPDAEQKFFLDPDKLTQVLTNLASNAFKFTPEGGRIQIEAIKTQGGLRFSVKDSGPGISKVDMKRLFTKFTQLERKCGPGAQGTGLGLAISKGIVELHGGKISVFSEVGHGTEFCFDIPDPDREELQIEFIKKAVQRIRKGREIPLFLLLEADPDRGIVVPPDQFFALGENVDKLLTQTLRKFGGESLLKDTGGVLFVCGVENPEGSEFLLANISELLNGFVASTELLHKKEVFLKMGSALFCKDGSSAEQLLLNARGKMKPVILRSLSAKDLRETT